FYPSLWRRGTPRSSCRAVSSSRRTTSGSASAVSRRASTAASETSREPWMTCLSTLFDIQHGLPPPDSPTKPDSSQIALLLLPSPREYMATAPPIFAAPIADQLALFDVIPLPAWIFDTGTLRFLAINDAAVRRYGYSRDEFLRMNVVDIRPAEDR